MCKDLRLEVNFPRRLSSKGVLTVHNLHSMRLSQECVVTTCLVSCDSAYVTKLFSRLSLAYLAS